MYNGNMTEEFDLGIEQDPELADRDDVTGDESAYDGQAVEFAPFDPTLFVLEEEPDLEADDE